MGIDILGIDILEIDILALPSRAKMSENRPITPPHQLNRK